MRKLFVFLSAGIAGSSSLWAMAQRPVDPSQPPPPAWMSWVPMVFMLGIFYFLLIRPQMKQKNERQKMLDSLKKGDKIVTQGGLIGTILNINPSTVDLKLNEETKIKIVRSAVADMYVEANTEKETVSAHS